MYVSPPARGLGGAILSFMFITERARANLGGTGGGGGGGGGGSVPHFLPQFMF